jgi:hypothetical protein
VIRACTAAICLLAAGCPEPEPEMSYCMLYDSRRLSESYLTAEETTAAWQISATDELARGARIELNLELRNTGQQDCSAAVYVSGMQPDLSQAPALDPENPPPDEVEGLGTLAYDRIVPHIYQGEPGTSSALLPLEISLEEPVFVTVVGCDLLHVNGWLDLYEVCKRDIEAQSVP